MYQPPDPAPFNETGWEIVRQIPEGIVSTYGQIASMIPAPLGVPPDQYERLRARWVGNAMRQVPAGSDVPWHRVINSQGTISIPRAAPPPTCSGRALRWKESSSTMRAALTST